MKRYYFKTSEEEKKNGKTMPNLFELYHDIRLVSVNSDVLMEYLLRIEGRSTIYFCDYFMISLISTQNAFSETLISTSLIHLNAIFHLSRNCLRLWMSSHLKGMLKSMSYDV